MPQENIKEINDQQEKGFAQRLITFIEESPSCYHVIQNVRQMLTEQGFVQLREEASWELERGGTYFCIRGDSSIIAFAVPQADYTNFQMTASHSDSPAFKIKENPEMLTDNHYVELNVEKYGGMIYAPWLDRPLSIAGKMVVRKEDTFETKLVNIDRDLCMIPNAAIHMNREVNEGYKFHAQKDMIPIFGQETAKGTFTKMLAELAGTKEEHIYGKDLFLYPRVKGSIWGAQEEFFSASKIDDLECAYTTMTGFMAAAQAHRNEKSVLVCCIFDNEEVGSQTKQGAASTFLYDVLTRINGALKGSMEEYYRTIAESFLISADNAHAVHPHHQDKADVTNRPYMNHGIVIKYNANQKYTTDAMSAAIFKRICENAEVPVQSYVNHSDIAGGSTLGNIANSQVSLNTIDIGLAQLAMHSPYETAGVKDIRYMIDAMKTFYETHIEKDSQGNFRLS